LRVLRQKLIDPNSPDQRPRRAAYALPTMFTAGNMFLGFLSVLKTFEGYRNALSGNLGPNPEWDFAARCIGVAVVLDGLDGRIARATNTVSDFGREMDSLADVITFGVAPAVLSVAWGVQFVSQGANPDLLGHVHNFGYFAAFLFLLCCAGRLARFNVQENPVPKNPGRPGRKYFVGLPTPASAGLVAAIIHATGSTPLTWWPASAGWILAIACISFLNISTWRYRSFKDFNLWGASTARGTLLSAIYTCVLGYMIWHYSQPVLLALGVAYCSSGVVVRIGGILRRWLKPSSSPPPPQEKPSVA